MNVLMIRAVVTPEQAAHVEAEAASMFAAIHAARPEGVKYASLRVSGTDTFVALLALEEGDENPLTAIPEFQEFQATLRGRLAAPPIVEQLHDVGSYRLL